MKIGIMQPYLFPYIGYWQLINAVDKFVIYDDVNFIKGGWINRNNILMNGQAHRINIRLKEASPNKLINQIEVLGDARANGKFFKTINQCYKKAPFYVDVMPLIEDIVGQEEKSVSRFLNYLITMVCGYLSISTKILVSSDIEKNIELTGKDKVIDICQILDANEYINAIGGQTLYKKTDFVGHDIELKFLETGKIDYPQFANVFVPNLSIIDVMMFNSKSAIANMLNKYALVE